MKNIYKVITAILLLLVIAFSIYKYMDMKKEPLVIHRLPINKELLAKTSGDTFEEYITSFASNMYPTGKVISEKEEEEYRINSQSDDKFTSINEYFNNDVVVVVEDISKESV
ncbi:MAG: hypothetical protein ACRCTA_01810, partial [Bacilli bacterium]